MRGYIPAPTHEPTTKAAQRLWNDERHAAERRKREDELAKSEYHCDMPVEKLRMNIHGSKV